MLLLRRKKRRNDDIGVTTQTVLFRVVGLDVEVKVEEEEVDILATISIQAGEQI